ncbi:MAG: efflux RND transporter periplasmic adaptor subunit [Desulfobulbaceae bacterium]|nr:efflux RND transporter periplasmic adaptor subunit [Desulfobulbaceae bacterium]
MEQIFPSAREDLEIIPHIDDSGKFRYLIQDPVYQEIYEIGEEEYLIFSLHDGSTSSNKIRDLFEERYRKKLSVETLEAFTRKLHSMRLIKSDGSEPRLYMSPEFETKTILLGYPDKVIRIMEKAFGVLFTRTFLVFFCFLTAVSLGIVIRHAGEYMHEMSLFREIWGPGFLLTIPLFGYFMLYPFSAFARSLACRHFGGQVSGFRLAFILRFIPDFIADISDALWIMEKSQRLKIFGTGILSLLFLWDISVIIWHSTLPWTSVHLFFAVFSLSAFIFMLLNLNPLVVRDGYFILQTWFDVDDLKQRAENHVRSLFLFTSRPEPLTRKEKSIFTIYGFLSHAFRTVVTVLLLGAAGLILTDTLNGIGALLFIALVCLRFENNFRNAWLSIPFKRKLALGEAGRIQMRLIVTLGLFFLFIIVLFIPYPFEVGGEFKVYPARQLGARSLVPGVIEEVLVEENDLVKKGQPLAVLDDRDILKNVESIRALIDETSAILNLRKKGPKGEEIAKAEQEVATAAKSYEYSKQEAERFKSMFERKAVPEIEYRNILRQSDLDKERLELARTNLALVKSGSRDEEIEALEAKLHRLELELEHARDNLSRTTLYSPIDGIVITPYISQKIGQRLEQGELFAVIEDTSKYIAEIEIPEKDINEVKIGAEVKLRTWAEPLNTFKGRTVAIGPVAYDKSLPMINRALSQRESLLSKKEILRDRGKVVRVLAEFAGSDALPKSDITGYAKIKGEVRPVGLAFTRWLRRLIFVEVWSWIP